QAVQDIINQVLEKLEENQVPMRDYALKSSGAAVIRSRTSPSFQNTKRKVFLYSLPVLDYVRSPDLLLEPENHPGNCWPFPGSQGHVFIKLSVPIIPRAVTMDHVSGATFHRESISRAPKDFAVY
ncbi:SUN domain-containing protein 3, partial [Eudyptula albosignata]